MPKKKQVFEPENLESIRSAISGLIVEPPETIEPVDTASICSAATTRIIPWCRARRPAVWR